MDNDDQVVPLTIAEIRMLLEGKKVSAVKSVRERWNCTLTLAHHSVRAFFDEFLVETEVACSKCGGSGHTWKMSFKQ